MNTFQKLILKSFDINPARLDQDSAAMDDFYGEDVMSRYMTYLTSADLMLARYREYDEMDEYSTDISMMLDKVSREAALVNQETQSIIWFTSENKTIEDHCNKMIRRLKLQNVTRTYLRMLAKYGRFVIRPIILSTEQPKIEWLDDDLHRNEEVPVEDLYYRSVETDYSVTGEWKGFRRKDKEYKHWEFVEFKLGAARWGESLMEGSRYIWRSLDLIEKSLELFRIAKSPQINIYRVPVGNADPLESLNILKLYKRFLEQQTRKSASGDFKTAQVPSPLTSIYFPISEKNDGAGVDIHSNNADIRAIEDVLYKRNKLLRKIGMPLDDDYDAAKNLSSINIDVASRVEDLQLAFIQGIDRLAQIDLALKNIQVSEETYEIHMSRPSDLEETMRLEKIQLGVDLSTQLFQVGAEMFGTGGGDMGDAEAPKDWKHYIILKVLSPYFGDLIAGYEEFKQSEVAKGQSVDKFKEYIKQLAESKVVSMKPQKFRAAEDKLTVDAQKGTNTKG